MNDTRMSQAEEMPVESVLRDELAHGDIVLGTIAPILGHLLANRENTLFNDEVVARIHGMAGHVASQLLQNEAEHAEADEAISIDEDRQRSLAASLATNAAFVAHCHALALEWQLARKLEQRNSIDPVLTPLMQSLIASSDANTASLAMATLASQARFVQYQRRMQLPLAELPGDLFHFAVTTWRARKEDGDGDDRVGAAEEHLRDTYDEAASRLGLISRLVSGMGKGARAALSISHSGAALFLSAMAAGSGQERDLATVATNESQLARLALGLRAAGLKPEEIEEQFVHIHPDIALPDGFGMLRADRAAAMLALGARGLAI